MGQNQHINCPIIVGGLGGSGTRVIAEILSKLGVYIGSDLNSASDNLWFAFLFKRPKWFLSNYESKDSEIMRTIAIFEKIMGKDKKLAISDWIKLSRATLEWSIFGNHFWGIGGSGRGLWPFLRVQKILTSKNTMKDDFIGWGWKEPNSHVYVKFLSQYFGEMKYIHLVRHGLDMAFSRNQAQLYNWGKVYNIDVENAKSPLPNLALDYWIAANKKAISDGEKLLGNRFLSINFENLCKDPQKEISTLLDFINIDKKLVNMEELTSLPVMPKTAGRYKKHDISIFERDKIQEVIELGFEVDEFVHTDERDI